MEKPTTASILEALDTKAFADINEVLSGEARRGLSEASARLSQTRTDVVNKLRELDNELGKRKEMPVSTQDGQRQVIFGVIAEFAQSLAIAVEGNAGSEQKLTEVRRLYGAFERKLQKVLDALAALNDITTIEVPG